MNPHLSTAQMSFSMAMLLVSLGMLFTFAAHLWQAHRRRRDVEKFADKVVEKLWERFEQKEKGAAISQKE